MTRERIKEIQEVIVPYFVRQLKKINYEGLGEADSEEAEKDLNEVFSMAIKALEQEPTTKIDLGVDCISRKAALDITWHDPSYSDPLNVLTEVRDKIRELPSVTPLAPKTGHWIKKHDNVGWWYVCDKCGSTPLWDENASEVVLSPYCPNCGADMRADRSEE